MKTSLVLSILFLSVGPTFGDDKKPEAEHIADVIYGRKFGMSLTMDVLKPARPNGAGIIFCVSGGWVSDPNAIPRLKPLFQPMLERGYTVFAVCHGAQPKFAVPEVLQDMYLAVRFIRANSKKYGIDPSRLGATGTSAGGHLSLMLGAAAPKGKQDAKNPLEREDANVQCVVSFVPPSDFLNYGQPGVDAVGQGVLKDFRPAFGLTTGDDAERQKRGKEISPIYFITAATAPSMIIHGEKDELVPIQQAEIFVKRCEDLKVPAKLVVKKDKGHGWNILEDIPTVLDWFDQHLGTKKQ